MGAGPDDERTRLLRQLLDEPVENLPRARVRPWPFVLAAVIVVVAVGGFLLLRAERDLDVEAEAGSAPAAVETAVPASTAPATGTPDARVQARTALDPERGRILLLGGQANRRGGVLGDAWEYDVATRTWHPRDDLGGVATRTGHALAHVPPLGGFLVVGGGSGPALSCPTGRCTSNLDDGTWLIPPTGPPESLAAPGDGPPPRSGHDMAYDEEAGLVVLFGGVGPRTGANPRGAFFDDTWVFDVETRAWRQVDTPAAPTARAHHAMVFDPTVRRVLLYGGTGADARGADFDLWAFDAERGSWEKVDVTGADSPRPRWLHRMAVEPESATLVLFGGEFVDVRSTATGSVTEKRCGGELWALDLMSDFWRQRPGLGDRVGACDHAMAPDGLGRLLVVQASEVSLYDPVADQWEDLPPLN